MAPRAQKQLQRQLTIIVQRQLCIENHLVWGYRGVVGCFITHLGPSDSLGTMKCRSWLVIFDRVFNYMVDGNKYA
jgi:hypothetical protein